jgi:hypothetical protein
MKKVIVFVIGVILITLLIVACKKIDLYGKYNAQNISLYSSIEILPNNIAKVTAVRLSMSKIRK